jgi:hypothetical protein
MFYVFLINNVVKYVPKRLCLVALTFFVFKFSTVILLHVQYCSYSYMGGSRGSSVNILCDYGLDDQAIVVRSPADAKGFFL